MNYLIILDLIKDLGKGPYSKKSSFTNIGAYFGKYYEKHLKKIKEKIGSFRNLHGKVNRVLSISIL